MVDAETSRTVIGIIGNIISFFLFLSPVPTFIKIRKAKSVQGFKPDPYVATVLNCAMWVFYGLPIVHPDSLLVVTINGVGFIIEISYVTIFFLFSNWAMRKRITMALIFELVFLFIVVFITLTFLHGHKDRSMLVGILCIIFNTIMYTSPLTVMRRVISTKSVKYMPFFLSLTNFANGSIWFSYALIKFDPYLMVPNGLGMLSGLVQLVLYATYYRMTDWDEDEKSTEIELPRANYAGV
ncbi:bidirectional sugar transporter SWEET5-like [Olea europaea subsp. europaea]|uniref:Bidirectional sugar transporter SWEET n=1 Tax=Olea europaea subsp. europaea TaxID=158383 RepID=A0A8S0SYW9_OLEEU|nr:bidirectional sugar transporter SWEET5-like [Olea europaea subsp. europaea]